MRYINSHSHAHSASPPDSRAAQYQLRNGITIVLNILYTFFCFKLLCGPVVSSATPPPHLRGSKPWAPICGQRWGTIADDLCLGLRCLSTVLE